MTGESSIILRTTTTKATVVLVVLLKATRNRLGFLEVRGGSERRIESDARDIIDKEIERKGKRIVLIKIEGESDDDDDEEEEEEEEEDHKTKKAQKQRQQKKKTLVKTKKYCRQHHEEQAVAKDRTTFSARSFEELHVSRPLCRACES